MKWENYKQFHLLSVVFNGFLLVLIQRNNLYYNNAECLSINLLNSNHARVVQKDLPELSSTLKAKEDDIIDSNKPKSREELVKQIKQTDKGKKLIKALTDVVNSIENIEVNKKKKTFKFNSTAFLHFRQSDEGSSVSRVCLFNAKTYCFIARN